MSNNNSCLIKISNFIFLFKICLYVERNLDGQIEIESKTEWNIYTARKVKKRKNFIVLKKNWNLEEWQFVKIRIAG